jgi:feruloyl esterase
MKFVDEKTGFINAIDPDLSRFKARGGKILMYHGWNDTAISPENSINYYNSVQAKMGKNRDVVRLFMMLGMGALRRRPGARPGELHGRPRALAGAGDRAGGPDRDQDDRPRVAMTRPICAVPYYGSPGKFRPSTHGNIENP